MMQNPKHSAPTALWVIAIVSLALNVVILVVLVAGLVAARQMAGDAASALESFSQQTISYRFRVNQTVPVSADVPFQLDLIVPVNQTLDVNTVVTVSRELPVIGQIEFDVPIQTSIPVSFEVPLIINQTFPITTDVALNLEIPLDVSIADTPLKQAIDAVAQPLKVFGGR